VTSTFQDNLRAAWVALAVRFVLLIVLTTEFILAIVRGWGYGVVVGAFFVLSLAVSIAAIVGGAWYASNPRADEAKMDAPAVAAAARTDHPPRCPPNYQWDDATGGCVPD
jgi:hypothetical protein